MKKKRAKINKHKRIIGEDCVYLLILSIKSDISRIIFGVIHPTAVHSVITHHGSNDTAIKIKDK